MALSNNSNFTRGAQLWAHNIRMSFQGGRNICIVGLLSCASWFIARIYQYLDFATIYYFAIERYVSLKIEIGSLFYNNSKFFVNFYSLQKQKFVTWNAKDFQHRFWNITEHGKLMKSFKNWVFTESLFEMLCVFLISCFVILIIFTYRGKKVISIRKLRGGNIVKVSELRRMLQKEKLASPIEISGLPLVKNTENQHILLTGTTGAGKTNMLNELLPQIRSQNQRAIIFDVTGCFVDRFFNPQTDLLLNPLEKNSVSWTPWNDCVTDEEFNSLSEAFIEGEGFSDKYWEEAAQKVFSAALKKESERKDMKILMNILAKLPIRQFSNYFKDTFAAAYVDNAAEKTSASVRSTLLNKIERLNHLKGAGDFSIKDWVNNGSGWLFITSKPKQLATLKPLISAWIDIAIQGLLDRDHKVKNENMWIILDELPVLKKIPSLKTGLAQGRKYGACITAGIQNISQLEEIYGRAGATSLLDMFNTRFYFAASDNQIAEYVSRSLGSVEAEETKESLSYGSNTMRDGVNINVNKTNRALVMPNEIKDLKPRTCYVKLPQGFPITLLNVKLQK